MGLKKKAKKASKKAKKTAHKAKKTVEKTADQAEKVIKKSVKKIENFDVSAEATELANKVGKQIEKLGDNIEDWMKDALMRKMLKELAEKLVNNNKGVIKSMLEMGNKIYNIKGLDNEIRELNKKQKDGKLESRLIVDLKKKIGIEDFF